MTTIGVEQVQIRVPSDPFSVRIHFLIIVEVGAMNGRVELAVGVAADRGGAMIGLARDRDLFR